MATWPSHFLFLKPRLKKEKVSMTLSTWRPGCARFLYLKSWLQKEKMSVSLKDCTLYFSDDDDSQDWQKMLQEEACPESTALLGMPDSSVIKVEIALKSETEEKPDEEDCHVSDEEGEHNPCTSTGSSVINPNICVKIEGAEAFGTEGPHVGAEGDGGGREISASAGPTPGSMPLKFIASKVGGKQLVHEGFIYNKDKAYKNKIYWRCIEYNTISCRGRAETQDEYLIKMTEHSHVPSTEAILIRTKLNEMKDMAMGSGAKPAAILKEVTANVPFEIAGLLPKPSLLKRTIQKVRQRTTKMPQTPTQFCDVQLPESLKVTAAGQTFLLYENSDNVSKVLIFATVANMQYLRASPAWQMDGTFKACPKPFSQIYSIHGTVNGKSVPLVYALLANRTTKTYKEIFAVVRAHTSNRVTDTCVMDFERCTRKAFEEVFPEIAVQGCYFHFSQVLWHNIKACGLHTAYVEDTALAFNLKLLAAIAYVPADAVEEYYTALQQTAYFRENADLLDDFITYFEETWLGKTTSKGRSDPRFSREQWNCYTSVLNNSAKTNNAIEEWHHRLAKAVGQCHPNLWTYLLKLKQEQSCTELEIEQEISQTLQPTPRKRSRRLQQQLQQVVSTFGTLPPTDYLRGVAFITGFST